MDTKLSRLARALSDTATKRFFTMLITSAAGALGYAISDEMAALLPSVVFTMLLVLASDNNPKSDDAE